MQSHALLIKN